MEDLFRQGQADKEAAQSFVDKWKDKLSKIPDGSGEKQHDEEFWNDLIEAFGKPRDLLDFQHKTAGNGYADVVSKELGFIAEQKSKNLPLDKPPRGEKVTPFQQAFRYRAGLTSDYSIRTIVTSNFEQFWFYNLMTNEGIEEKTCAKVALEEIPDNLNLFKSLFRGEEVRRQFGILTPEYTEMAAKEVAHLYDALKKDVGNPRFSEAQKKEFEEKIPLIIMRIVFLLFADNTSADVGKIFSSNQFTTFLEKSTDAAHFNSDLGELFRCLNIESEEERVEELIPEELMSFPYVDGGLFEEPVKFPSISEKTFGEIRDLERKFKQWDEINISVFGPIMGNVFSPEERRKGGIYYTSRENILKIINPLFMDELRGEFAEIKAIRGHEEMEVKLKAFHDKLSRLQFFDPACGSGNFLTETYMELRDLEDEVINLENSVHDLDKDIKVSLSQFHGIELEKYSVMVARTALQIAMEQALERSYERFKDSVSTPPHFLPLKDEARGLICGNALTMDWGDLDLTPSKDLFVFGNPPFKGKNKSKEQQKELEDIFAPYPVGKLDYCAAWLYKAATFLKGSDATFAFVSTNSIVEGEQVGHLFQPLRHMGWKISFAYPPFKWDHDAEVAVVIIGFSQSMTTCPILYQMYEVENGIKSKNGKKKKEKKWKGQPVENISPYLSDGPDILVPPVKEPIAGDMPKCVYGNKFADRGNLVLKTKEEKSEAEKDPIAAKYVREYIDADELIHGKNRWCLWLKDSTPEDRKKSPVLRKALDGVKEARKNGQWKDNPTWLPVGGGQPDTVYLAIPSHFSENRDYFTTKYESPDVIASNALFTVDYPDGFAFSVIETSMFMTWQNWIGGRLEMRKRFGNTIVWNTFPLPSLTKDQKDRIIEGGAKVLEARANYPDASLADLYDPGNMPSDLKKAHEALDKAMDAVFSDKPLRSEEERQKALLKSYEEMTGEKAGE